MLAASVRSASSAAGASGLGGAGGVSASGSAGAGVAARGSATFFCGAEVAIASRAARTSAERTSRRFISIVLEVDWRFKTSRGAVL